MAMSQEKIGQYIHYKYANYLQYGTRQPSSSMSKKDEQGNKVRYTPTNQINVWQAATEQRNLIIREVRGLTNSNKDLAKKLEDDLNFLYRQTNSKETTELKTTGSDLHKIFIDTFNKKFKSEGIKIDNNLKASYINPDLGRIRGGNLGNISQNKVTSGEIMARIFQLRDMQARLSKNQTQNNKDQRNALNEFFNNYKKMINSFEQGLNELIAKNENKSTTLLSFADKVKILLKQKKNFFIKKNPSFIEDLNQIYEAAKNISLAYYTGLAAEMAMPYFYSCATNYSKNIAIKLAKNLVNNKSESLVGQQRSALVLNSNLIATDLTKMSNYSATLGNAGAMQARATQDKVDVILTFNGDNETKLYTSVKNYNLAKSSSISLLSGVSLLKYLQMYGTFLNHYLNVTVEHPDSKDKHPNGTILLYYHNTMLYSLALKALAGGVLKRTSNGTGLSQMSEYLIINDNSSGKIKVYSTKEIMNKLYYISDIQNFVLLRPIIPSTEYWWNKKQNESGYDPIQNAYRRISMMLTQLNIQKLHVSLKTDFLY